MSESVANAVFLQSKAGKEEELAVRLEELVLASRSHSGVMIYDLHRSTAEPASWFLYERYESQDHFNRHRENPVLQRFVADAATLLDGKLGVRTFRVITDLRGAWGLPSPRQLCFHPLHTLISRRKKHGKFDARNPC